MKPRSSTEIFASSSGRKRPLRYTVMKHASKCDERRVPDLSLEPQTDGVPCATEQAREGNLRQCNQRILAHRLGVESDLDDADALSSGDGSEQRLDGLERELQLLCLALRQRHILVGNEARRHRVGRALPHLERAD